MPNGCWLATGDLVGNRWLHVNFILRVSAAKVLSIKRAVNDYFESESTPCALASALLKKNGPSLKNKLRAFATRLKVKTGVRRGFPKENKTKKTKGPKTL